MNLLRALAILTIIVTLLASSIGFSPRAWASMQIGDSATAKAVDSSSYQPINRTNSFNVHDSAVYSWLKLVNISSPTHDVTWHWLTPEGHEYQKFSTTIPDPGQGRMWTTYYAWSYMSVNNSDASQTPGSWKVDVYLDGITSLTQTFAINDTTLPVQPMESFSWPSYTIPVRIVAGPTYAVQDVTEAMKQWNSSQLWFQKSYGLQSGPVFSLVVSNSTNAPVTVVFNQTQSSPSIRGYTHFHYYYKGGVYTSVTCDISLDLSLMDGTKLNDVAMEDLAMHELGHCLGLDHVWRYGDLMNALSDSFHDVKYPTTLNLYALYRISSIHNYGGIPSSYVLPSNEAYTESPAHNLTKSSSTTTVSTSSGSEQTTGSTISSTQTTTYTSTESTVATPEFNAEGLLVVTLVALMIAAFVRKSRVSS